MVVNGTPNGLGFTFGTVVGVVPLPVFCWLVLILVGELAVLVGEKCTKAPKAKPVMRPERAKRMTAITATLNACESPVLLFVGLKLGLVSVCILRNRSFLRFLKFWYFLA